MRGGIRPRYETLPSEAGNELPKNQPKKNYPCTPPSEPPARPRKQTQQLLLQQQQQLGGQWRASQQLFAQATPPINSDWLPTLRFYCAPPRAAQDMLALKLLLPTLGV